MPAPFSFTASPVLSVQPAALGSAPCGSFCLKAPPLPAYLTHLSMLTSLNNLVHALSSCHISLAALITMAIKSLVVQLVVWVPVAHQPERP